MFMPFPRIVTYIKYRRLKQGGNQPLRQLQRLISTGDDTLVLALTANLNRIYDVDADGTSWYMTLRDILVDEATVKEAYKRWGNNPDAFLAAHDHASRQTPA
jgi:hypothetical protein